MSNVKDHLDATRTQLLQEIDTLDDTAFNRKPDVQSWSVAQICHHLVLVEEATRKAIAWGLKAQENSTPARKNVQLILDRTKKIQAPSIVEPTEQPFTVQAMQDLLATTRKNLLAFLQTIEDPEVLAKRAVQHPALGELPLDQWIEMVYLHEQRHIEQLQEIVRE
ncbi:DinB family protein [Lysinibacillus fusiformis]|uniref:DinB family protein n=1 Tax=Lysinibacillus fusiformis TaxID=28031 RepID=UPI001967FB25|nr:DinB family protein [Lysinibacillus fusiformis]QSB09448.1 DinB family protein [Lysinibacillus fusiformis]